MRFAFLRKAHFQEETGNAAFRLSALIYLYVEMVFKC